MKRKSMYEGLILEGRWQYQKRTDTNTLLFKNIYNSMEICLSHKQVEMILNGHDTIGHIMTRRAPKSQFFKYGNSVQKSWQRVKYKNVKKIKKV